jgi:DNA (cytosine-5)-methyltransferase 3A
MNILSLFDGMSCAQIALNRAGIKYKNYYAAEIDKYAIKITNKNYPNTIQLGDITKIKGDDLPKIDLLIGGSPCQGFSFAGKQLNFDDPRSKLFFEYVRLLNECEPKYFILENVKMKKEYKDTISKYLNTAPIEINSSVIVPISRRRLYWSNLVIKNIDPINTEILLLSILKNDETCGTIGTSNNRCIRKTKIFGALTQSMYKGVRAAGRPLIVKNKAVGKHIDSLKKNVDYSMLAPVECERLQTVPDNYTEGVSNTQRYRMLGNGFTVDVIVHLLKGLNNGH